MAWGDAILPALRPAVKVYVASGRFLPSQGDSAVYAVPDRGLLSRAEANRAEVESALAQHFGRPIRLRLMLDEESRPVIGSGPSPSTSGRSPAAPEPPAATPAEDEAVQDWAELEEAPAALSSPEQRLLEAFPGAEEVQP
jgi:hypothetical protein